jgi:hypothetical protein
MSMQLREGMVLRTTKPLTNASMSGFKYFRESAPLAKTLPPSSSLKIVGVASAPPIWAKFSLQGYPANATLKLSAEEIRTICGLPATPTLAPVLGMAKYKDQLERTSRQSGISKQTFDEFLAYWEQNELAFAKKIMAWADTADNAVAIFRFFAYLRNFGFSLVEIGKVFAVVASFQSATARNVIFHVVDKWPLVSSNLRRLGKPMAALGIFITAIELYNLSVKGEWGQFTSTLYKTGMGLAVPWAAIVDTVWSLFPEVTPASGRVQKVVRACDPIGLGGVAVESFVWMVQSLSDAARGRDFNDERLSKLVNRMKQGPTSIFAEIGERAGDALFEIMEMDATDWKLVGQYTVMELGDFLKGFGSKSVIKPGPGKM